MPTIIKDRLTCTAEQARYLLEMETKRGGLFVDIDRAMDYYVHHINAAREPIRLMKLMTGDSHYHPNSIEDTKAHLIKRFGVSEHFMIDPRDKKVSAKAEIVEQLMTNSAVSEDAKEFLKLYRSASDDLYLASYMDQYIQNPLTDMESYEGHRMALARPTWSVLVTGRISARQPSCQNINRNVNDIFTYPKGYLMLYSDSGQIEPRIRYSAIIKDPVIKQLILLYNDAYYGQLHYIQMSDREFKEAYANPLSVQAKPITPAMEETRKDLKVILLKGTYGSGMTDVDPLLFAQFKRRLLEHPLNKALESDIRDYVEEGGDVFYSPFGTPVKPDDKEKYPRGSIGWRNHLVRCGLNNPLQSAASDCMNEAVSRSTTILRTKAKRTSFVGYFKHDEGLFYLAPGDHGLKDELRDCLSYDVELNGEKWIPIISDEHIGKKKGNPEVPVY